MIIGNSTDPVLIRKIALKVWSLRDEVMAIVHDRLKNSTDHNINISDLIKEYGQTQDKKIDESENVEDQMQTATDNPDNNSDEDNDTENNVVRIKRYPKLPKDQFLTARTILAEITMDEMFFFCGSSFVPGQSIVIEFLIPKNFIINAVVNFCNDFNMNSKIISKHSLKYRINVTFSFLRAGERTLLRQFLESIHIDPAPVVEVTTQKNDTDDDLDNLDDL